MRLDEIESNILKSSVLSTVRFKKLMKMIKNEINGGNISAVKIKNRILRQWNAGERCAMKYDIELNNINLNIKKLLK